MEKENVDGGPDMHFTKKVTYGVMSFFALAAAFLGVAPAFAANTASGVVLTSDVVTGMKAGIGDAVQTIQTSVDNAFLTEVAVMFIGFAVIVGVVMYIVKGHRRI